MVILLVVSTRALAGPTPPIIVNPPIATFTGDQSNGIWPAGAWSCPPIYTYNVYDLTTDITPSVGVPGIKLVRQGANGANGADSDALNLNPGGNGKPGGSGGEILPVLLSPEVNFTGGDYEIITSGADAHGISAGSIGGNGGNGGSCWGFLELGFAYGGDGGTGGYGLPVIVTSDGSINTVGDSSIGIYARSEGGNGGNGGWAHSATKAEGGDGGAGGKGSTVTVTSDGSINTTGDDSSHGIDARSEGGDGGNGGPAWVASWAVGGDGGKGGSGGAVEIYNYSSINTGGDFSHAILGMSQGGKGGHGGFGLTVGGNGGNGGDGGAVIISSDSVIATLGTGASGIYARSNADSGGNGGSIAVGLYAKGGNGGAGGGGGTVTVTSDGSINTSGDSSHGIDAASQGGIGGNGGSAYGAYAQGGNGGAGGDGTTVTVTSNDGINTSGDFSYGIRAVSEGGDGGNGGSAYGVAAVGGDGGIGGSGGTVSIQNNGNIETVGNSADGIVGQSLGGAGGSGGVGGGVVGRRGGALGSGPGGEVIIANTGDILTSGTDARGIFAESVGGFAGSAGGAAGVVGWGSSTNSTGDGGNITVTNSGAITTTGNSPELVGAAILAQSIGGGGGDAASSYGLVALGGSGSAGGNGGEVKVTNSGQLQTFGNDAYGIMAQSTGGGGGSGGNSYGLVALGGDGESTGDGGSIEVINTGEITTAGDGSASIFAQSIGGGGGVVGGYGGTSYSPVFSMGGDGASGGKGDSVIVNNSGNLQTSGIDSSGIFAQSVGGGGGSGGGAYGAGIEIVTTIGGDAELGGDGGQVDVDSGDISIITEGTLSHGIHAQSIGGGGGSGGNTASYTGGISVSISASIGGKGDGGGDGGAVNLSSASQITTQGEFAHGLYAESVGGGGGSGGKAIAWALGAPIPIPKLDDLPAFTYSFSMGGKGGAGGSGQAVTVKSTGDISTSGSGSYGILAQSVGGGGGAGGNSKAGTIAINSYAASMSVGGAGGKGGRGEAVDMESSSNITTQGDFAYGILGQSVGGGGGSGGNSTALLADIEILTGWEDLLKPDLNLTLSVGGMATGGGYGGQVDIANTGNIDTKGEFAHGILAQSVGGGGGVGGDSTIVDIEFTTLPTDYVDFLGFMNVGGKVFLGGNGGAGGYGSVVNVVNHGNINTEGNFANGILAQSIGGGGGVAGYVHNDIYRFTSPMSTMVLEGNGGSGGSGGDVTVENSGNITTHGGFSHGILAQSIAGGGGLGGISEDGGWSDLFGPLYNGVSAQNTGFGVGFAGSTGGWGSARAVNVTHTGSITTLGDMSHGIFAQSAAGTGSAGPVTVTLGSEIIAEGVDSHGILAQSIGGGGNGNISIDIGGGTVRGGSGTGAGVNIDGGFNNTLINAGNISALSGTAIIGGVGNETVNNNGIVTGSVDLGAGVNAFYNNPGATFNPGAVVNLEVGNALTNDGILEPGGSGAVVEMILNGDYVQAAAGLMEIEIGGFTPGTFDFIDITGTADLTGGNINFSFMPGYDIASEIAPDQSMTLQFLNADSIESFASTISYDFLGSPVGFNYNVFQEGSGLYFQATNGPIAPIPAPGAFLLVCIGLGCIRGTLRRTRQSAQS